MISKGEGKEEEVWRTTTFREFGNVFRAIPPWPGDNQYLHCLGRDILEPLLWPWVTLALGHPAGWWQGWRLVLVGFFLGGWMMFESREERIAGGGELRLNRWFISRLQDLQPSLPMCPPDRRAEELNPDQMFPVFHYQWMAGGHGGRGGGK